MNNAVAIKIRYWKTEVVITPNQLAMRDAEISKLLGFQISTDCWMVRMRKEWQKVDRLHRAVIKSKAQFVATCQFSFDDVNYLWDHLSPRVMVSGFNTSG